MPRTVLRLPFDGKRLRVAREDAGHTQQELANLCTNQGTPVSRFQVVRAESGKYMPQPEVFDAFVAVLNIDPDDLLTPREADVRECAR
ncbi:helix-turn-helix domain-containing protein [Nonomuraea bangladeshensis]|uniref:helix-turn-helix domain-containing protein n=1 Tax=Nonomuraea bangladeshensis TaxID=404385 RepID=UPI003C2F3705